MDLREWRRQLRLATGEVDATLALLEDPPIVECLKAAGAALLAIASKANGSVGLVVERTIAELRARDWGGDLELAAELQSVLGVGTPPALKGTPVDLDALGELLDGPGGDAGLVDLESGLVWSRELIDNCIDAGVDDVPDDADEVRWLSVWPEGHAGRDRRAFIETVTDDRLHQSLERAFHGRGAFRRVHEALERSPAELTRWHAFNDDRRIGRARAWLAAAGYRSEPQATTP